MTNQSLGTVPLRRRGPRQGLRFTDPNQARAENRLAHQRALDIIAKRTAGLRMASPDLPPQGGRLPLGILPGSAAAAAVTVPLWRQRFNDDDMAALRKGKHEGGRFEDTEVRRGECSRSCMERPSCMERTHAWIPFDFVSTRGH